MYKFVTQDDIKCNAATKKMSHGKYTRYFVFVHNEVLRPSRSAFVTVKLRTA